MDETPLFVLSSVLSSSNDIRRYSRRDRVDTCEAECWSNIVSLQNFVEISHVMSVADRSMITQLRGPPRNCKIIEIKKIIPVPPPRLFSYVKYFSRTRCNKYKEMY